MGNEYHRAISSWWILVLVATLDMTSQYYCAEGRKKFPGNFLGLKHKGTVKTIESHEDGDVIDCVDIYQQPTFDNSLIKDIQMEPSSYPSGEKVTNDHLSEILYQNWHKYGDCPEGTIPIRRTRNKDFHRKSISHDPSKRYQYATIKEPLGAFHGARAIISVWNPYTYAEGDEFSSSQIWVESGIDLLGDVNSIQAGWIVYPKLYGDYKTRLFTYWTSDSYSQTGCYDLDCPGFIQTSHKIALGGALSPLSTFNGVDHNIEITIYKDKSSGNWWLQIQNNSVIGYWPGDIFTSLADSAMTVSWGGEVIDEQNNGRHTEMGSGYIAQLGLNRASYIRSPQLLNYTYHWEEPTSLKRTATNSPCYDIIQLQPQTDIYFYGGPGLSVFC